MPRRGSHVHVWSLRSLCAERPRLTWVLVAVLLFALLGELSLRLAAPAVRWRLDAASDKLRIWLSPGQSPLAGYVFRRSRWTYIDELRSSGGTITLRLKPGEIFSARVAILGPDPSQARILAFVPASPVLVAKELEGNALVLHASEPLVSVEGVPAGSWQPSQPDIVTLRRQTVDMTYSLKAVGQSGGQSVWQVTVPALPQAPVIWFGSAQAGQVYLTIDDGWYRSAYLLRLMRTSHVPITAFLIADAAAEDPGYWRDFVAAGGLIEDHTASHANLTGLTLQAAQAQWRIPIDDFAAWFGVPAPSLGRPPYGAFDADVQAAAWAAGLKELVMWDVVWTPDQGVSTWNGGPIQAGDIVLLHWVPGVGHAVEHLLKTLQREGLHPARLTSGV